MSLISYVREFFSKVFKKPKKINTEVIHQKAEIVTSKLPPLLVSANRVASTVSQGVHGRRRIGQGETFWQFRRYEFGDSTSLIDWRQSGKSQHVFVRETEWEAAQTVWLWRDGSASMNFRSNSRLPEKIERSDLLFFALSSLLVRGGERIALLGSSMKPSSSRTVLAEMCSMIEEGVPRETATPITQFIPRYSNTIWFGDFLSPLNQIRKSIAYYAGQGVRGCILQVLDPAERQLPYDGRVLFGKMEKDEKDVLIRNTDSIRDNYKADIDRHINGLEEMTKSFGWKFFFHQTNQKPEPILHDLFVYFSKMKIGSKCLR